MLIAFFIFNLIGLIACLISTIMYFKHTASWSSLKQVNEEYTICFIWGFLSMFGGVVSLINLIISGIIIFM